MFTVYILKSLKDGKTYVGQTQDFLKRLHEHNSGRSRSTKSRAPFELLLKEVYESRKEAKERELWWKSSSGRRKLKEYFKIIDSKE